MIGITAGILDVELGFETEFFFSLLCSGIVLRNIACSSWSDDIRNLDAGSLLIGMDKLQDGRAFAGAQVVDDKAWIFK